MDELVTSLKEAEDTIIKFNKDPQKITLILFHNLLCIDTDIIFLN
jgi:hypothetical protein